MGKYLDLHSAFEAFLPLSKKAHFGLVDFLSLLTKNLGEALPEEVKLSDRKKYSRFLNIVTEYLQSFIKRTTPLIDQNDITSPFVKHFEDEWRQHGGVENWEARPTEACLVDISRTIK